MDEKFFVPFDTAKLLKENGYDTKVSFYYTTDGVLKSHAAFNMEALDGEPCLSDYSNSDLQKWYREENYIAAPTYHEVLDWLEKKGYPIESACLRDFDGHDIMWVCGCDIHVSGIYPTREEAFNDVILDLLNIL